MRFFVLMAGLLICGASDSFATIRLVDKTTDLGPGSLRYEVANSLDGDTIDFAESLTNDTIELNSVGSIFIKKNIHIIGPGPTKLTVNAKNNGRIFLIGAGKKVVISGLNIINGAQSIGGGIWNKGQLELRNSHIRNCLSTSVGGAIASGGDTLILKNCYIYRNIAESFGGAIYIDSGSLVQLDLVSLDSNITKRSGGGLYGVADFFDFKSVIFRDNRAQNAATEFPSEGGGFEIFGDLYMNNSVVVTNYARDAGGGVQVNTGTQTFENTLIVRNITDDKFGGIHIRVTDPATASMPTTFFNCRIEFNLSANEGGGIGFDPGYADKVCFIDSSLIRFNYALNENGGGVFHSGFGKMNISRTDISFNRCGKSGSGIYTTPIGGLLTLTTSTVHGNLADSDGGGIYHRSPIEIIRSSISENSAFNNAGAILSSSDLTMYHCTVADNVAILGDAALYKQAGSSSITGCLFDENISLLGINEIKMDVPIFSFGNNLINSDSLDLWLGLPSDILGQPSLIGPLTNNGGPTLTHALTRYSPARDAGGNDTLSYIDQRGEKLWNSFPDIGSYEYDFCDVPQNTQVSFPDSAQTLLTWEPVQGASVYSIEGGPVPGVFFLTVYSYSPSKLAVGFPSNSSYHWRIRTLCNINSISAFSPLDTFTTPTFRIGQATRELSVYPNPSQGQFTVAVPPLPGRSEAILKIYDSSGREVYMEKVGVNPEQGTSISLNLPDEVRGAYWMEVRSGSYRKTVAIYVAP